MHFSNSILHRKEGEIRELLYLRAPQYYVTESIIKAIVYVIRDGNLKDAAEYFFDNSMGDQWKSKIAKFLML